MDPYQPPSAALPEPPPISPKRFRFLPVFVGGALIDFGGSQVLGVVVASLAAAMLLSRGLPPDQVQKELPTAPMFVALAYGLGSALTLVGGYVAARWAGFRFVQHGAAAGAVALLVGLPFLLMATPWAWHVYVGLVVQIPLAAAGGWLAQHRFARS